MYPVLEQTLTAAVGHVKRNSAQVYYRAYEKSSKNTLNIPESDIKIHG